MLKMSIRRKLFLAFTLVAAISSAALLALARSYIGSVRAQLDRKFLDDARGALDRQQAQGELNERRVFETIKELARDPNVLTAEEPISSELFQSAPALAEIVVWDAQSRKIVRSATQPGSAVTLLGRDIEALAYGPLLIWNGDRVAIDDAQRTYALAFIGSEAAPRGVILALLDSPRLCTPTSFGRDGQSVLFDAHTGQLWLRPDSLARLRDAVPGLQRLLAQRPRNGETADVDDGRGHAYRVYSAVSG
ncbi:MAG TPA: hypothetical protein VHB97_18275, partial [Polyangia bacterium]|nr:hypothetical protein [Polyangia bacterium]